MARRAKAGTSRTDATITGPARVGRRTKDLVKRIQPGDIAVIDHQDIDRVAADALVDAGAAAVVNASECISGRYPNGGPSRIVAAGIPLLDRVGRDLMDRVYDGEKLTLEGGELRRDDTVLAVGVRLTPMVIDAAMEDARGSIGVELERFAANTLEYIGKEARIAFEPVALPPLNTDFHGRHALDCQKFRGFKSPGD